MQQRTRTRLTQLPWELRADRVQSLCSFIQQLLLRLTCPSLSPPYRVTLHTVLIPSCTEQRASYPMREKERGGRKQRGRSSRGEHLPTGQHLKEGVAHLISGRTWLLGPALSQHAPACQPQAREETSAPTSVMEARNGFVSSEFGVCGG